MKNTTMLQSIGLAALLLAQNVAAQVSGAPATSPADGTVTSQGCFSSQGNLTVVANEYQSSDGCRQSCQAEGYWVMGLVGRQCKCGYVYPPADDKVDDAKCNFPCPVWPQEACGSEDQEFASIFNTGIETEVDNYSGNDDDDEDSNNNDDEDSEDSTSSAAPSPSSGSSSSSPAPDADSTGNSDAGEEDESSDEGGSTNVGAIAGGVVAGVVIIAAGIGGLFFWMRRKRNAEIEEEHRRNAAVNAFISGAKPPSTAGSVSMSAVSDARLDPVLARRRLSDGSIADNEDYSRRILRVTNA